MICKIWEQCCAGRIKDLVESGKLSLSAVKYFILDEADRLLDTGNQELILDLFSRFPKAGTGTARLQVFFSALAPCEVSPFAGWDDPMADGAAGHLCHLAAACCSSVANSFCMARCNMEWAAAGHTGTAHTWWVGLIVGAGASL